MLQASDVDDDYFTPSTNTKLSNIFQEISTDNEHVGNETLKYVPPKPGKSKDELKTSECVLACPLTGFVWLNNVYTPRGKIGFAIMKNIVDQNISHNIILYDVNKITLSCTTISPELEIKVMQSVYISYFDNARKYWSIRGSVEDTTKIINFLRKLQVQIKIESNDKRSLTKTEEEGKLDQNAEAKIKLENKLLHDTETDNESNKNKKIKASILSRIANMGQSILPPLNLQNDITSDSSETTDVDTTDTTESKLYRQRATKKSEEAININRASKEPLSNELLLYQPSNIATESCNVLMTNNTAQSSQSDINVLMAEQRINNSELRINMGRLTDKVDMVINQLNTIKISEPIPASNNDILYQKLIREYEEKINNYEKIIKTSNKSEEYCCTKHQEFGSLKLENERLKVELQKLSKDSAVLNMSHTNEHDAKANLGSMSQETVKEIMNDTFQNISVVFQDNVEYSGDVVKNVIGSILKKATLKTLGNK